MGPKNRGRPRVERPPPVDFDDAPLPPSPIDGLLTLTQRRLLCLLFGQPHRAFALRELRELTRCGSGAGQRELRRLARAGLVSQTRRNGRRMVQADPRSPIHAELVAMVRKTVALAEPLREAFAALQGRIRFAFAVEQEGALRMLVVVDHPDTLATDLGIAHDLAEHMVGRCFPMTTRTPEAFRTDAYVAELLEQAPLWLFGKECG